MFSRGSVALSEAEEGTQIIPSVAAWAVWVWRTMARELPVPFKEVDKPDAPPSSPLPSPPQKSSSSTKPCHFIIKTNHHYYLTYPYDDIRYREWIKREVIGEDTYQYLDYTFYHYNSAFGVPVNLLKDTLPYKPLQRPPTDPTLHYRPKGEPHPPANPLASGIPPNIRPPSLPTVHPPTPNSHNSLSPASSPLPRISSQPPPPQTPSPHLPPPTLSLPSNNPSPLWMQTFSLGSKPVQDITEPPPPPPPSKTPEAFMSYSPLRTPWSVPPNHHPVPSSHVNQEPPVPSPREA